MRKHTYKHGKYTYKTYLKPAGKGFEAGIICAGKPLFVGNFLYKKEANAWFTEMTNQLKTFTRKYWITPEAPKSFYFNFLSKHLYKNYYKFLDKQFAKYERTFNKEFNLQEKKYKNLRKEWHTTEQVPFKKSA